MRSHTSIALFAVLAALALPLSAADRPLGSETVQDLASPGFAGAGAFTTSRGGSAASAMNPAAAGTEQRTMIDAGYLALPGLGSESGLGHAANLGVTLPTKFGVFGGAVRLLSSPFDAYPVGTFGGIEATAAKELFPRLTVGAGLGASFGTDWSLALDLGVASDVGDVAFMKDLRWAITLGGLGKGWAPTAFTPTAGVAFGLIREKDFSIGVKADLGAPGFTDLAGRIGLEAGIAGIASISSSYGFDLSETLDGKAASPIPSFGLTLNFALAGKKSEDPASALSQGEVAASLAARPLYEGIWAIGTGAVVTLGLVDREAPVIKVGYAETRWISPNADGKVDDLVFPLSITDRRYVAGWAFEIRDGKGDLVRTIRNKERRAENEGIRDIMARLADVKSGVEIPSELRWDGNLDSGAVAPDGPYSFVVKATDDNGNAAETARFEVIVDNTPPAITVENPEESIHILSPDGDGSKDVFPLVQSGSKEELWTAAVLNASGAKVRTYDIKDGDPISFEWDGRDDAGAVVPDGVYRYAIAATDRALNSGAAGLDNIIVDTVRPPVNVVIDEGWISPNGDGIKDELAFSPGVPVRDGLVSWTIEVIDESAIVRRTFSGGNDVPARLVFDGMSDASARVAEGRYYGAITIRYLNGYVAKARSPVFVIDVAAPLVNVLRPETESLRTFSPDGDSRKDSFALSQSGSREDRWAASIRDASGKTARTLVWENAAPAAFEWDGKDDAGRTVADGAYSYEIGATDRAGNKASARAEGIMVDTSRPAASLAIEYTHYSPNGDGIRDELPLSAAAEKAGLAEAWKIELVDARDAVRRTFSGLMAPPERTVFGSEDDAKGRLSEGTYRARLSLSYRNGYLSVAESPAIELDLTPPRAVASAVFPVFSPNGDGNLDEMVIAQTAGEEPEWKGEIARNGVPVRGFSFTGTPPAQAVWDGRDDSGKLSPDGEYSYRISATDRAGNSGASAPVAFSLSTADTPVLLTSDLRAFSPNGDGAKDLIALAPQVKVAEGIVSWKIEVLDLAQNPVRSFEGGDTLPASVVWNGKDAKNAVAKEGMYTARAEIRYAMGNRPVAQSAPFALDVTAPAIELSARETAFSPNGDKQKDTLAFARATREGDDEWTARIRNPKGGTIRTWRWTGKAGDFEWDGKDDAGNIAPDAVYALAAEGRDLAGNVRAASVETLTLDTVAPRIELSVTDSAFSPDGDGSKDLLRIAQKTEGSEFWESAMEMERDSAQVRSWTWKGTAKNLDWDGKDGSGKIAPDGTYRYVVRSTDAAGNRTEQAIGGLVLDNAAPELELSLAYRLFSPNGDGRKDELPIAVRTKGDDEWEAFVTGAKGIVLASWKWKGEAPALAWNGKDEAGNVVADGNYRLSVRSTDPAGNKTERNVEGIAVDNRATRAFLTASANGVSPNGDGAADGIRFALVVALKEGIESWKIELIDENLAVRRVLSGDDAGLPESVAWDGKDDAGTVREGRMNARLSVAYLKGDLATATAGPILVDASSPTLALASEPRWFSPDNDGVEDELAIGLIAKDASAIDSWSLEINEPQPPYQTFYKVEGKGTPTSRIVWDGRSNKGELVQAATDYQGILTVIDVLGNKGKTEAVIGVDVLVIREGNVLKIKVPSIIFRENEPDFVGLPQETVDNNIRVLKRIATILNKFKDYKVKVEGHANPVVRTPAEEKNELQPLSERRAKAVLAELVKYGVDGGRLSAIGMGGTRPVAKWEERADWWKNRRVEFILIK